MEVKRNKLATVGIVITTVLLAGVAIFTAIKLYNSRNQAVAPNAPTSKPAAQEPTPDPCAFTFTIDVSTSTPTATSTSTSTSTATATATSTGTGTSAPTTTPTTTATATATSTATTTPTATSTSTSVAQSQPTETPSLPEAGTSWPTIVGGALGILAILGAFVLAF